MPRDFSVGLLKEKNRLDPASAWTMLFELELSQATIRRYANLPKPFTYRGAQYDPAPVWHDDLTEEIHKGLDKVAVHVANVSGEIQDLLEGNDGLRGRKVTLILVNLKNPLLGDRRASFYVESCQATEEVVTFALGKPIPIFDLRGPSRIIDRDLFPAVRDV